MRLVHVGLGVTLALAWSSLALADTPTGKIGDQSGKEFTAACAPGQALVGYRYNSDFQLEAISTICRTASANGTTGDPITSEHFFGLAGGNGQDPLSCPGDMAIQGLGVYLTAILRVHHVRATCHPLGSGPGQATLIKATSTTDGDTAAASHKGASCGPGAYASGLIGTSAGGLNSLGLLCHKIGDDTATAPPNDGTDTTADTGDGNSPNTNTPNANAPNVVIQFGPLTFSTGPFRTGQLVRTGQPTTVYRQPDGKRPIKFLQSGDKVLVVGCADGGQGWCRIVKPVDGFLWGADLAH